MAIKDIDKKLDDLEKQKNKLEKERLEQLVNEEKAFKCVTCSKIVIIEHATPSEKDTKRCYNCISITKKEDRKKEILKKIKNAKVVDIELDRYSFYPTIKTLTVNKQGTMYDIVADADEDDAYMTINNEWKETREIEEETIRPGMKKRVEKPLILEK